MASAPPFDTLWGNGGTGKGTGAAVGEMNHGSSRDPGGEALGRPGRSKGGLDIQDQSLKASASHFSSRASSRGRPRLRSSGANSWEQENVSGSQASVPTYGQNAPQKTGAASAEQALDAGAVPAYPSLAKSSVMQAAWDEPCTSKMPRASSGNSAPTVVRLSRIQAWTRMASYEACLQVCQEALLDHSSDPDTLRACREFLRNRSHLLRSAFEVQGLFFSPCNGVGSPHVLEWDEGQGAPRECHTIALHDRLGCIQLRAVKISQNRNAFWTKIRRGSPSLSGVTAAIYPKSRPGDQVCWSQLDQQKSENAEGSTHGSPVLELQCSELDANSALLIELRGGGLPYPSRATILAADLLQEQADSSGTPDVREAWIPVHDGDNVKVGKVLVGVWTRSPAARTPDPKSDKDSPRDQGGVKMTAAHMYQSALRAALQCLGCGPRRLEVSGSWRWLLDKLAAIHGVHFSTTVLAHLQWVLKSPNATPTPACLALLSTQLQPLLQMQQQGQLLNVEAIALKRLLEAVDQLLSQAFESYRRLSEDVDGGVLENGSVSTQAIPPSLGPAVSLFCVVRDPLNVTDQCWLTDCLKRGIQWRYSRLESEVLPKELPTSEGEREFRERVYLAAGTLCNEVLSELRVDLKLHSSGVFPSSIDIAACSACEYCNSLNSTLVALLNEYRPKEPSKSVMQLVQAVGTFQACLEQNALKQRFSVELLFVPYVSQWISGSKRRVLDTCHSIATSVPITDKVGGDCLSTAGKAALETLEVELQRYEVVVQLIPQVAVILEDMCKAVLLKILAIVDDLYCLESAGQESSEPQAKHKASSYRPGKAANKISRMLGLKQASTSSPSSESPPFCDLRYDQDYALSSREALLLNSMRQLMVAIPRLEALLSGWGGDGLRHVTVSGHHTDGVDSGRASPSFGAQLAQVLTEIRIDYSIALKAVVDRMANHVLGAAPQSLERAIGCAVQTEDVEQSVASQLQPLLRCATRALKTAAPAVQTRLLVALTRGLWEKMANRLYLCIQELNNARQDKTSALGGGQQWQAHQNTSATLRCIDETFKGILESMVCHDGLKEDDMKEPSSSSECNKLLFKQPRTALAQSFVVY